MARIRTIKPEFPQVASVGRLSRDAQLTFILLWTVVDDFGRSRAGSRLLASLLFPYDRGTEDLIDGWLDELVREKCVELYEVDGEPYLQVSNWLKHQKIDHPTPSKLPAPCVIREDSREAASSGETFATGPRTLDLGPRTLDLGALRVAETPPELSTVDDAPLDDAAPRRPQDEMFEAVCEACGLDTTLLDANTRIATAKLARELVHAEEPWAPEEVRRAGEDWYDVRWKGRQRSQVSPPQVRQLRTWLGQCEERRRKQNACAWAVQR